MRRQSCRWLGAAVLFALLLPSRAAEAVIPSAMGPIQALIVILPQILLALAAGLVALFKPKTYKLLLAYLWSHKITTAVLAGAVWFLFWGPSLSGGKAAEEKSGAPWVAFRGGPGRTGAVAGAKGFVGAPRVQWNRAGEKLGKSTTAVDSSIAVVGNRLYFGVAYNLGSPFGSGGAIVSLDADNGNPAWIWTGKGELDPPLRPVFSSPAVWCEPPEKGEPPAARYLVCGEGYHEDKDGRIICLDLEPVRKSKGKEPPKLAWFLQATDHAEASPCILDGKVISGCGDDGVWCLEIATGKVIWHINGEPDCYQVVEGPKAAALASLAGKTVIATGVVKRVNAGAKDKDDPGQTRIDLQDFREASGPPVPLMASGRTLERAVFGKVVVQGKDVQLKIPVVNPDSESCPVGVTLENKEQRILFGSGLGGQRVNCVKAETGEMVWQAPTPYPAFGAPTVAGDRVLIGCGKGDFVNAAPDPVGMVFCFSLNDGKELWSVKVGDTILGSIAAHEGRAYVGSRDGIVYVIDVAKGEVLQKLPTGAPILSSPAVAADTVYAANTAGKVFSFDRKSGQLRATLSLNSQIISSPAVGAGRLFIGTHEKGVFALADRPKEDESKIVVRPWQGPGGNAGRTGCVDDRGLPQLQPDKDGYVGEKWLLPQELQQPARSPISAEGTRVSVVFEKRTVHVDAISGKILEAAPGSPQTDLRGTVTPESAGPVIRAHGLVFACLKDTPDRLTCLSEGDFIKLWSAKLDPAPTGPPTVAGDKVFVTLAGKDKAKGFVQAHKLVDGTPAWRQELDDAAISHPVAAGDWVAVATADDKIAVFRASDGKAREPILVGGKPVAPALWNDVLVVAGHERIAAYDLSSSDWLWNYKDQDNIGDVVDQPVICNETVWVGTTKKGLVAIGVLPATKK